MEVKAKFLIEALPYFKKFNGHKIVIKYGGSTMDNDRINETIIQDIVLLKLVGLKPIIVHGGGKEISSMLNALNIESEFIDGLRVTTKETMEVVEMVLAGKINKDIVSKLSKEGANAIGISGKDGNLLSAKKMLSKVDLGYVGEITKVNTEIIDRLVENNFIPVIAPIGQDEQGNSYNINADHAAVAIASALNAKKLVFLTDVEGVLRNKEDSNSLIHYLSKNEALELIKSGIINGGMIPKVNCCIDGVNKGISMVHILDGRKEHPLILEIYTHKGIGTMVYDKEDGYEGIIA